MTYQPKDLHLKVIIISTGKHTSVIILPQFLANLTIKHLYNTNNKFILYSQRIIFVCSLADSKVTSYSPRR